MDLGEFCGEKSCDLLLLLAIAAIVLWSAFCLPPVPLVRNSVLMRFLRFLRLFSIISRN